MEAPQDERAIVGHDHHAAIVNVAKLAVRPDDAKFELVGSAGKEPCVGFGQNGAVVGMDERIEPRTSRSCVEAIDPGKFIGPDDPASRRRATRTRPLPGR